MGGRKPLRPIRVEGGLAYVPLTRGLEATIDAADVPLVEGRNWHSLVTPTGHVYAATTARENKKQICILMHRALVGALPEEEVDHADGNGLNNRRKNLRPCSRQQNVANQVVSRMNRLGLKGVRAARTPGRYRAKIRFGNTVIDLGSYGTPEEAAAAYRGAAKALHGEFARDD